MSDTIWQQSRRCANWVIVVDIDEFLYHPDLRGYLDECSENNVTVIDTTAYDMVSDRFPPAEQRLTDTVVCGVREPFYDKLCIFNPNAIASTNYAVGRHTAAPTGRVVWPSRKNLMLLHYKMLGIEYVLARSQQLKAGLRSGDIVNQWGKQYLMTKPEFEREFRRFQRDAAPVPGLGGISNLELLLNVDGRATHPAEVQHNRFTFHPPSGTGFRLTTNPEKTLTWRQPGVPVSRIFIRTSTGVFSIEPDDPRLTDGWLAMERIGPASVRWTGTDAILPIPPKIGRVEVIEVSLKWPLGFDYRRLE